MDLELKPPCSNCRAGEHENCNHYLCGCLAPHPEDSRQIRVGKQILRFVTDREM